MQFFQSFVPSGARVGVLAMVAEFFLLMAVFAFLAGFVFFLASKNSIAPRHRGSAILSAVIMLISGLSYWFLRGYFHDLLHQMDAVADAGARRKVIHDGFLAVNQYRYAAWAVTTPLLLLKMVLVLRVKPREVLGQTGLLLAAGFWMTLAWFIGEQGLDPRDGTVLVADRLFWGALGTVGYLVIVWLLFRYYEPRYAARDDDDNAAVFRLMILSTVTIWGVYPLGYLVPAVFPKLDLDWLHIAFTVADLVSQIGLGMASYLAGAHELEQCCPQEAIQESWTVG